MQLASFTPGLVTVVIPTYNRGDALRDAIHSVYAQTYQSFELIIVDDGSTDGTAHFLTAEANIEPRLTVIYQSNSGPSKARNTGLQHASGEFVAFLDSDDVWLPRYLKAQVETIKANKADFSITDGLCEESDGTWKRLSDYTAWRPPLSAIDAEAGTWIIPSFTVFERAAILNYKFDESLQMSEDTDLMIRILVDGGRGSVNRSCDALYRSNQRGHTQLTHNDDSSLIATYDVWKRYEAQLPMIFRRGDAWAAEFAALLVRANRPQEAVEILKRNTTM